MELVKTERASREAAVTRALALIQQALKELQPHMVYLTAEQRKETLRAPLRLNEAGRAMVYAAQAFPRLLAACPSFDADLVIGRLEDAELIAPLANQALALARLAEAYGSTLSLYRTSKVMARGEPALQAVIQPLAEVFAARKRPAREEDDLPRPRPARDGL